MYKHYLKRENNTQDKLSVFKRQSNITPESEKGKRFEIWLELLLNNYANFLNSSGKKCMMTGVIRNVYFHKNWKVYRQADLVYHAIGNRGIEEYIVEAKYVSKGPLKYMLRNSVERKDIGKESNFDNLVDQIIERQEFSKVDRSILVTNSYFDNDLMRYSKGKIDLVNGDDLVRICKKIGFDSDIEKAIIQIDLKKYPDHNNHVYVV
jgi:hypothetical protein